MIVFYERNTEIGETLQDFATRVNTSMDEFRAAKLELMCQIMSVGTGLAVVGNVGEQAPVRGPNGQVIGMRFADLSEADVKDRIDAHRASLERVAAGRAKLRGVGIPDGVVLP